MISKIKKLLKQLNEEQLELVLRFIRAMLQ